MNILHRYGDPAIAVVAVVLGLLALQEPELQGPLWANVIAVLVFGGLVLLRQRHPRATTAGFVALALMLSAWLTPPPELPIAIIGLLLFGYSAGTVGGRWGFGLLAGLLAGIVAANLSVDSVPSDYIFPPAVTLAAFVAGRSVVYRSALAAELEEAAARAEQALADEERRAVADERRRIAREMHDVVAHSISVMVVQAGGARRILERDPARAEQAAQIERTGRETLLEMRRLLGMMHGGTEPAELEPSPTLDALPGLIARLGAELIVDGDPQPVSAGLGIGAYRVVEDALVDVRRTVPGATACVTVRWAPGALELSVADDRPYAGPLLPGVQERVAVYGGSAQTGPRPGGDGHQLDVRFPLENLVPQGAP